VSACRFFDPVTITDSAQAEAATRAIIGHDAVDSITIMDRTKAWSEAQELAARALTPMSSRSSATSGSPRPSANGDTTPLDSPTGNRVHHDHTGLTASTAALDTRSRSAAGPVR
jgi:hypothetical protein